MSGLIIQRSTHSKWDATDDQHLIEFVALNFTVEGGKEWPGYRAEHPFWSQAAQYLSEKTGTPPRKGEINIL